MSGYKIAPELSNTLIRLRAYMSKHMVLAREWRPKSFDDIIGQETIVQALKHGLNQQKPHHAYLFTGTRGVGKTTLARIIAKCLNCEEGVSASPCQTCGNCQSIGAGNFVDLYEVDAASKTKVEDTRDLLLNAQYAPVKGRYKVFLIDEVHMLSKHSFNALLKTLEEPPPHLQFILATTEPEKLPATIISRCIHFKLRPMPPALLAEHMAHILTSKGVVYEAAALEQLSHAASGSVRDALSLLDQAMAYGTIDVASVLDMLGLCDVTVIAELLLAVETQDAQKCQEILLRLREEGVRYMHLLQSLMNLMHRIALLQCLPDYPDPFAQRSLAQALSKASVQLYYDIALKSLESFTLHPSPSAAFEIAILRMMVFQKQVGSLPPKQAQSHVELPLVQSKPMKKNKISTQESLVEPLQQQPKAAEKASISTECLVGNKSDAPQLWCDTVVKLKLSGRARAMAEQMSLDNIEGEVWHFSAHLSFQSLLSDEIKQELSEQLTQLYQKKIHIKLQFNSQKGETPATIKSNKELLKQKKAHDALTQDANVEEIMNSLGASLIDSSTALVKENKQETDDER